MSEETLITSIIVQALSNRCAEIELASVEFAVVPMNRRI